jgi:ATP/maltotriose-dependent transcriptional regulator MalT
MIREVLADGSIDRGGAFQSIPRPRVQARLAEACAERVALIVAPAGYGKSVALKAYFESLSTAYVRYDVDERGGNLAGFVRGFVESLEEIAPTASASLADALRSVLESKQPGAELASWLHAHIKAFSGTIVVDDFHKTSDDEESARFLSVLIEKTKARTKWLLATRSTLDLPVASWLAYGTSGMAVDEHDLGFTLEEARASARSLHLAVRDEELSSLLELTGSWPTAVVFSLRSSTRSNDLKNIAATTREMIYRYLAEQVYHAMPDDWRDFLRDAALLPRLDISVLQRMGYDRAEGILEDLRRSVAFISVDSPGVYRIHDLFRDFLEYESRMLGKEQLEARMTRVARALENSRWCADSLALYRRVEDWASIVRVIENRGFELSAKGGNESLESAINSLPNQYRTTNPVIVGFRAMFQADRGRLSEGERLFRKVLSFDLDPHVRARFALSFNSLLVQSGRTDAIAFLERTDLLENLDSQLRAETMSSLAGAYAVAGRIDEARLLVDECLGILADLEDATRAAVLARLSLTFFYFGEYNRVEEYASEGAALSSELGLLGSTSRCFSSLYAVSSMRGDNTQALWYAQQMAASATKAANKALHHRALLSILDIESQRGNVERVDTILRQISDSFGREALNEPFVILETLALRSSWNGIYDCAAQYLGVSLKGIFDPSLIAMRRSLMALFAAACENRDEALEQLQHVAAFAESKSGELDRLAEFALGFAVIANIMLGRNVIAKKMLRSYSPQSDAALPIWGLASHLSESSGNVDESDIQLTAIAQAGYGGYAMMLRMLPAFARNAGGEGTLTPTEQAVLSFLHRGMRPKAIAESTGRSVHTVQNHIRSVISKLGTSGRDEALVVARRRGLVPGKTD